MADVGEEFGLLRACPLCSFAGLHQLGFGFLPARHIAQDGAIARDLSIVILALAKAAQGQEQWDLPAVLFNAGHLAAVVQHRGNATVRHGSHVALQGIAAVPGEKISKRPPGHLIAFQPKHCLRAGVQRQNGAVLIQCQDAVSGRVGHCQKIVVCWPAGGHLAARDLIAHKPHHVFRQCQFRALFGAFAGRAQDNLHGSAIGPLDRLGAG